jgi:hypothetical protein
MPTGIEQYGITYGLSDTTKTRIQTGFDEIRSISGWENFRIPSYVWDYVDQNERDRLLTWLQTKIWTTLSDNSNFTSFSREAFLAWTYTWGLLAEWWADCATDARPAEFSAQMYEDLLTQDCGIPSSAIAQLIDVSEQGTRFLADVFDPLGSQDFAVSAPIEYDPSQNELYTFEPILGCGPSYYMTYLLNISTESHGGYNASTRFKYMDSGGVFTTEETYYDNDYGDLAFWVIPPDGVGPPPETELEKYGKLAGLDDTTKTRLITGFDQIRSISGWESFQIPPYIWNWVTRKQRDHILNFLQIALWVHRDGISLPSDIPKTAHLAFVYTLALLGEWYYLIPYDDKPAFETIPPALATDWGFPLEAVFELPSGWNWGFDGKGYRINDIHDMDVSPAHPYYSVSGYESGAIRLPVGVRLACYPTPVDPYDQDERYYYYLWTTEQPTIYTAYEFTILMEAELQRYREGPASGWDSEPFYMEGPTYTDYTDPSGVYSEEGFDPVEDVYEVPEEDKPVQDGDLEGKWGADWNPGIKTYDGQEVLGGSVTFRDFGLMDGHVEFASEFDVGTEILIEKDFVALFKGVVTEVQHNLAEGIYTHRIADPVTAGGGTVEYSSGNAIAALQEAIENHGGTFSTEMTTTETVFYPDEPQDTYQFFRAVSYAVGGVLQYGRDGVYRLVEVEAQHLLSDADVIADDTPVIEEHSADYANYVQATIDERWRTEATTPITESYSIGSQGYSATRLGEQIQSETISLGGDSLEITYTYDANGYMTKKEHSEEGSGLGATKKTSLIEWTNISVDGNQYNVNELHEEFTYCQLYDNNTSTFYNSWVPTSKTTREWQIDLDGMAYLEEEIWGTEPLFAGNINVPTSLYPELGSLVRLHKYRGGAVVNPAAGPLEGRGVFKKYNYVHNGFENVGGVPTGTVGYVYAGTETRSVSPPTLEMCAAEDEHEVHIIAGAKDLGSIDVLGLHKYETQAVALDTDAGMQNFALGVLYEKSRIRRANISTAMGGALPLDTVGWRDVFWRVQSVSVNLGGANDSLTLATQSNLDALSKALPKNPVTWTEDVRNAINRRVTQFDNVSRGKVLGRVGKRRYSIQAEGKAEPIEAKALNDDPVPTGSTVLIVKPTGKNQPWTLLSPSKEGSVSIPIVMEQDYVTPSVEKAYVFYIGPTTWDEPHVPKIETRQAVFHNNPIISGYWKQVPLPAALYGKEAEFEVDFEGEISLDYTVPGNLEWPNYSGFGVQFRAGSMIISSGFYIEAVPQFDGTVKLILYAPNDNALLGADTGWRYHDWYHWFYNHSVHIENETIVSEGTAYSLTRPFNVSVKVYRQYDDILEKYVYRLSSSTIPLVVFIENNDVRQTSRLGIDEQEGIPPDQFAGEHPYNVEIDDGLGLTMATDQTAKVVGGEFDEWIPLYGHVMSGWAKATLKNIKVAEDE